MLLVFITLYVLQSQRVHKKLLSRTKITDWQLVSAILIKIHIDYDFCNIEVDNFTAAYCLSIGLSFITIFMMAVRAQLFTSFNPMSVSRRKWRLCIYQGALIDHFLEGSTPLRLLKEKLYFLLILILGMYHFVWKYSMIRYFWNAKPLFICLDGDLPSMK